MEKLKLRCSIIMLKSNNISDRLNRICIHTAITEEIEKKFPVNVIELVLPIKVPILQGMTATYLCTNGAEIWNGHLLPQHLYFLSNNEIKERDYYINIDINNNPIGITKADYDITNEWSITPYSNYCKKIETTTNLDLNLPLIPQSFIEKYVSIQGEIKEVNIELEIDMHKQTQIDLHSSQNNESFGKVTEYKIKTRNDNTVICSAIKTTFTLEEVQKLVEKAFQDGKNRSNYQIFSEDYFKSLNL